ncbi:putative E3 ubiquitin-protein ligase BAH1-like [Abeliophyllum distichum]|uniref:E3 ubiquitin-protein ligase BAH1-like n=1 Tax=Abeliophyllum distichum TaxID=126358 RepID=A0ABD1ST79_9LAMI
MWGEGNLILNGFNFEYGYMREQRAILENETICKQVEDLRSSFPSSSHSQPLSIENHPVDSAINGGSVSPEIVGNGGLDMVYKPYALGCWHLFCKSRACSAASVMIFEGLNAASPESKYPVRRGFSN